MQGEDGYCLPEEASADEETGGGGAGAGAGGEGAEPEHAGDILCSLPWHFQGRRRRRDQGRHLNLFKLQEI
jgi:hypothetical protein